ncbi:hypothetical protein [Paludisphaera mucosa]|uniref:Uncharacterized protein n=1 Tax=Paludisphaera mucosa TaxID=3030827 RepID=A0ABT6FCK7_9BACT|nr:hypothetical protein [Paludisphaera mucosa]MDG3005095.1 hypothetical protein [Paludisphaera mucosa]
MGRWLPGLAILMVVGGFGLVAVGPGTAEGGRFAIPSGMTLYTAGWLLGGVLAGCRTRRRNRSEPWSSGSEGDAARPFAAVSRALAASSRTGLVLMLVGSWIAPAAIRGLLGIPTLLAEAVACFIASTAIRRPGNFAPAVGAVLLVVGWLLAALAAMEVAQVAGDARAGGRGVPALLPFAVAAPILVGVGFGLHAGAGRRDRLGRAAVVVGLLLAVALLAALTRGFPPRSL